MKKRKRTRTDDVPEISVEKVRHSEVGISPLLPSTSSFQTTAGSHRERHSRGLIRAKAVVTTDGQARMVLRADTDEECCMDCDMGTMMQAVCGGTR